MSREKEITSALALFTECNRDGDRYVITTQHYYPSNKFVSILLEPIHKGTGTFRVSDGCGAIDCLSAHGIKIENYKKLFIPSLLTEELSYNDGALIADHTPTDILPSVVPLVAKTSVLLAEYGLKALKTKKHRDLEKDIHDTLKKFVSVNRIHREKKLTGASNRQYTFDFVVPLEKDNQLVIDAVVPEAASLNAKVVSHLDIAKAFDGKIQQRLIYDDEEEWKSSDLNLLQMAATVVPISRWRQNLKNMGMGA